MYRRDRIRPAGPPLEMLSGDDTRATLYRDKLPCLPGTRDLVNLGVNSTLYPGNLQSLPDGLASLAEQEPLLCDPQTSGGLLLSAPPGKAARLVEALAALGHPASVIGEVHAGGGEPRVELLN